jgi:hypothetical protein
MFSHSCLDLTILKWIAWEYKKEPTKANIFSLGNTAQSPFREKLSNQIAKKRAVFRFCHRTRNLTQTAQAAPVGLSHTFPAHRKHRGIMRFLVDRDFPLFLIVDCAVLPQTMLFYMAEK